MLSTYKDPFLAKRRGTALSGHIHHKEHYPPTEAVLLIPHEALRLMVLRFHTAVKSSDFDPRVQWKVNRIFDYLDIVGRCLLAHWDQCHEVLDNLEDGVPSRGDLENELGFLAVHRSPLLASANKPSQAMGILGALRARSKAFHEMVDAYLDAQEEHFVKKVVPNLPPGLAQKRLRNMLTALLQDKDSEMSAFFLCTALAACEDKEHGWGSPQNAAFFRESLPMVARMVTLPLARALTHKRTLSSIDDISLRHDVGPRNPAPRRATSAQDSLVVMVRE